MSVAHIIGEAKQKNTVSVPAGAAKDLKAFLAHNDASPRNKRVSAERVMAHLADEYGLAMGRTKFDRLVKQVVGRGWGN